MNSEMVKVPPIRSGDHSRYFLSVRTSKSGACVPSRRRREGAIVSLRDVVQHAGILVESRIQITCAGSLCGVYKRDQGRPQRRYGTGSAEHSGTAIDADVVAAIRVRIAADIGDAAILKSTQIGFEALLPGRHREEAADATAGRAAIGAVVPHNLFNDRAA